MTMTIKGVLFFTGAATVALALSANTLLPEAPSSIQSNAVLEPIGIFLIDNTVLVAIVGIVLILFGLFL